MNDGKKLRSNGYVSDGEGYRLRPRAGTIGGETGSNTQANKRTSKSGRFGSQSSFHYHGSMGDGVDQMSPDKKRVVGMEDDEEDDDEEEDIHPRSQSRTPDTDDNLMVQTHPRGPVPSRYPIATVSTFRPEGKGTVQKQPPNGGGRQGDRGGNSSCEELFAVEVMEQTMLTTTVRRSNSSNVCGRTPGVGGPDIANGGQRAIRDSRTNSRQGMMAGSSCSDRSVDSQVGGKRSDTTTGSGRGSAQASRPGSGGRSIDGYRSEGSNDSPMHNTNANRSDSLDLIEVVDAPIYSKPMNGRNKHKMSGDPSGESSSGPTGTTGKRSGSRERQCSSSKSLNAFERQESSASFQSGQSMHSTHSAPPSGAQQQQGQHKIHQVQHHGPQRVMQGGPFHHQQGPSHPPTSQQQRYYGQPPLQNQSHHPNCQISNHVGHPPPPGACIESCSTQSSSSSASAPPDYATCSTTLPPSYDQALDVPPKSHHRGKRLYHIQPHQHTSPLQQQGRQQQMRGQQQQHIQHQAQQHQMSQQPQGRKFRQQQELQQQAPKPPPHQGQQGQGHSQASSRGNDLYYMGEFYG